jgi:hypothetical protein
MPEPPDSHVAVTVWTAQGGAPGAPLVTLAGGQRGDDLDRSLDDALHLRQGLVHPVLELCTRLGGLYPVIADTWKTFGTDMLHHTADERVDVDSFPFHPLALVRTGVIGDAGAIIAIDAPERDRRADDLFRQIGGEALGACRDISFLHVRHQPRTVSWITGLDESLDLLRLHSLPPHRQEIPLPLLA